MKGDLDPDQSHIPRSEDELYNQDQKQIIESEPEPRTVETKGRTLDGPDCRRH